MGAEAKSRDELKEMSMVDLAYEILKTEKQPLAFQEIAEQIKEVKQPAPQELEERMARFYTNLNLDGRFLFIGENHWGLRGWYPFDQSKEDIEVPKKKRKKKKKLLDDYEEDEDYEGNDIDDEDDEDYSDEDYSEEDYDEDDEGDEEDNDSEERD
ncbi:MAG TPA: DNA-directed RNA polymerase subunit delta [Bacillales bacterium]